MDNETKNIATPSENPIENSNDTVSAEEASVASPSKKTGTTKKTATKKATSAESSTKKSATKSASTKSTSKTAGTKKAPAKKADSEKKPTTTKKSTAKKADADAPVKKTTTKKAAPKSGDAEKEVAKKPATKKTSTAKAEEESTKKTTTKKSTSAKAATKKAEPVADTKEKDVEKTATKKTTSAKATTKKPAAKATETKAEETKKAPAKKATTKKETTEADTAKKETTKKAATKPADTKKETAKKPTTKTSQAKAEEVKKAPAKKPATKKPDTETDSVKKETTKKPAAKKVADAKTGDVKKTSTKNSVLTTEPIQKDTSDMDDLVRGFEDLFSDSSKEREAMKAKAKQTKQDAIVVSDDEGDDMQKKQKKDFLSITRYIVMGIEAIAWIALMVFLICIKLVPLKLIAIGSVFFVAILAFQFFLLKKGKILKSICILLGLIILLCTVTGFIVIRSITSGLNEATKISTDDSVVVYVRKDAGYTEIKDLAGATFGIAENFSPKDQEIIKTFLKNETKKEVSVAKGAGLSDQVTSLKEKKIQALVLTKSLIPTIIGDSGSEQVIDKHFDTWAIELPSQALSDYFYKEKQAQAKVKKSNGPITESPFLVYISGLDTRGSETIGTTGLSDVNMLAVVNPKSKKILLINTPRDYYVGLYGDSSKMDKLTHAGVYGIECSMETLSALYDVDISYYVKVNFSSVISIVDALGGITVDSDYDFYAHNYHFNVGENELNGDEALAFARERHSFPDGDRQRGKNQQKVIKGIVNKATSPAVIKSLNDIATIIAQHIKTDMTQEEINSLIRMELSDMAHWDIESTSVTGPGDYQYTYSYSGTKLYVMRPDMQTVEDAKTKINELMES